LSNRQRRITKKKKKNWDIPISLGPLKDKVEERNKKIKGNLYSTKESGEVKTEMHGEKKNQRHAWLCRLAKKGPTKDNFLLFFLCALCPDVAMW
jgi:hypothetical protein